MREETGECERALGHLGFAAVEDFVAHAQQMDRVGGVAALVFGGGFFQQAEHAGEFGVGFVKLGEPLEQSLGRGPLLLGLTRLLERIDDIEVRRFRTLAHLHELGFPRGNDEAAVRFQLRAQRRPPALERLRAALGESVVRQHRVEIFAEGFHREAGVEIADDAVDELHGIFEGLAAHGGGVGVAARFDVGLRDRHERGGGESHVHRLAPAAEKLEL